LGDCPVFASSRGGCPFKGTLCSNGVPLIDAVEYRSWGVHAYRNSLEQSEPSRQLPLPHSPSPPPPDSATSSSAPPSSNDGSRFKGAQEDSGGAREGEEEEVESPSSGRVVTVAVSVLLKEGTKEAHKRAENVHFVREFVHGRVSKELYGKMVGNLYFVYKALEDALDLNAEHALVKPVHFGKELHRAASLEQDLAFYYGEDWRELTEEVEVAAGDDEDEEQHLGSGGEVGSSGGRGERRFVTVPLVRPSAVAAAYVARLERLGGLTATGNGGGVDNAGQPPQPPPTPSPELLVPHAYTRYLGDLSGGQVLKRAAIKGMGLDKADSGGVRFYEFEHISNMKEFKAVYRQRLDSLGTVKAAGVGRFGAPEVMDSEVADLMVAEANYAFELNTALFVELDLLAGFCDRPVVLPTVPDPAAVRAQAAAALVSANASQLTGGVKESAASKAASMGGCPFASLAKAGVPMPAHHRPVPDENRSTASEKREDEEGDGASKCPIRSFSMVDVAVVLVLIALMLIAMPSKVR